MLVLAVSLDEFGEVQLCMFYTPEYPFPSITPYSYTKPVCTLCVEPVEKIAGIYIAQMVERSPRKQSVSDLNPTQGSSSFFLS